jgi:hypothetical protein
VECRQVVGELLRDHRFGPILLVVPRKSARTVERDQPAPTCNWRSELGRHLPRDLDATTAACPVDPSVTSTPHRCGCRVIV